MPNADIHGVSVVLASATSFSLGEAFRDASVGKGFFVHDSRLYVLSGAKQGLYVVEFANDGSIKAQIKLAIDFFLAPSHFAVFSSGEYLVVGLTGAIGETGPHLRTPFTAVFAADGRLVKKIYEPEDEDAQQRAEGGDPQYLMCCGDSGNEFVGLNADVTSGSDGNVYLLHGSPTDVPRTLPPFDLFISQKAT